MKPRKVSAFVGLGANLETPQSQLRRAFDELALLPDTRVAARSSLWRSAPLGYAEQPDFVNAVARIETGLTADALLSHLQRIETEHGRSRSFANAPRTLDLDLLLFGNETRAGASLDLPHPRMHERAFVLLPLVEIAADAAIPGHGSAAECLAALDAQDCERIAD